MAFVTRSSKKSPFDPQIQQKQQEQLEQGEDQLICISDQGMPDQRIHANVVKGEIKKYVDQAKARKLNRLSQPEIQYSDSQESNQEEEPQRKKNCYNFKNLRKVAYQRVPVPKQEGEQEEPTEYYELPGCLRSLSMVKYGRRESKKSCTNLQQLTPSDPLLPKINTTSIHPWLCKTQELHKIVDSMIPSPISQEAEIKEEPKKYQYTIHHELLDKRKKIISEQTQNESMMGNGRVHTVVIEEKIPLPSYQNSVLSIFKKRKTLGIVALQNRSLISKLQSPVKEKNNHQNSRKVSKKQAKNQHQQISQRLHAVELEDQYEYIKEKNLGPSSYSTQLFASMPSSPTFPRQSRFPFNQGNESQNRLILEEFRQTRKNNHRQNRTQSKETKNNNPSFGSRRSRFDDFKYISKDCFQRPLQYQKTFKQLIKESKNRKYKGFQAGVPRTDKENIDERPFYKVDGGRKKDILAEFGKSRQKREVFNIDYCGPGPDKYNLSPSWYKQHSTTLKPDPSLNSLPSSPFNYALNCSLDFQKQNNLEKQMMKMKRKGVRQHSQVSSKLVHLSTTSIKKSEDHQDHLPLPEHYLVHKEWQSKSHNIHFSKQCLRSNNMCKNKLL